MSEQILLLMPKRWQDFQHYKDRCPPWIKLHRDLLNNKNFIRLPTASKALAPLFWLLASESKSEQGVFDASDDELEFRLRMPVKDIQVGRKSLIDNGFFSIASGALADCQQVATPEESRGETETERETKKSRAVATKKCPSSFQTTTELLSWVSTECPFIDVDLETQTFRDHTFKHAITDWAAAWRNWMRKANGYAKERRPTKSQPVSFKQSDAEAGMLRWEEMTGRQHPDRVQQTGHVIDITPKFQEIGR